MWTAYGSSSASCLPGSAARRASGLGEGLYADTANTGGSRRPAGIGVSPHCGRVRSKAQCRYGGGVHEHDHRAASLTGLCEVFPVGDQMLAIATNITQ
jgi:hypothetical protein